MANAQRGSIFNDESVNVSILNAYLLNSDHLVLPAPYLFFLRYICFRPCIITSIIFYQFPFCFNLFVPVKLSQVFLFFTADDFVCNYFHFNLALTLFFRLLRFSRQHIRWVTCHMAGLPNSELFTLRLTRRVQLLVSHKLT